MIEKMKSYRAGLKARGQLIQAAAVGRCILLSGDLLQAREKMNNYRRTLIGRGETSAAAAVERCLNIETEMRAEILEDVQERLEVCRA